MHLYAVGRLKAHFEEQVGTERVWGNRGFPPQACPALGHALTALNDGGALGCHPPLSCYEWVLASRVTKKLKYTQGVCNVSDSREGKGKPKGPSETQLCQLY